MIKLSRKSSETDHQAFYVTSNYMLMVLPLLDELAINKAEFFAHANVDVNKLGDPSYRISHEASCQLWQKLFDITQDEYIGLKAGRFASPKILYPLGTLLGYAKTPLEGLETLLSHFHLFSNTAHLSLVKMKSCYSLRFTLYVDGDLPAVNIDAFFSSLITICRQQYGDSFSPSSIRTVNKKVKDGAFFQRFFRCPIAYNDSFFELTFDHGTLEKKTMRATGDFEKINHKISKLQFKEEAEFLNSSDFIIQVKIIIKRNLTDKRLNILYLAERLYLGERTLQRKLAKNQCTFRKLVEECRHEMAVDYINYSDLNLSDISDLLGFSSYSNFARAFKSWAGETPKHYKTQLQP